MPSFASAWGGSGMGSEWQETTLGEICLSQGGSIQTGPFGSQLHASDYLEQGIPVVMPANIGDNGIVEDGIARIGTEDANRLSQHKLNLGDVVFSRRGDVTRNALIRPQEVGWLCGTGCLKVRLGNESKAKAKFIAYVLRLPETKEWLIRHAVGATMPNLNTTILAAVPVLLPPMEIQELASGMLGALDDKIALLRETNATLEAIAQGIFKSWFVDFDPVRAKGEGRDPEGMPPEVVDLFPSEFEDSELGAIPKGWRVVRIGELLELSYGKALKATDRTQGEVPVYGSGGINGTHDRALIDHPTVIVGRKGTVGSLYWEDRPCFPIDTVFFVKPMLASLEFCFRSLQTQPLRDMNTDAAVPGLNRENVYRLKVGLPPPSILEVFDQIVGSFRNRMQGIRSEVSGLEDLRDTLLPRLMSGKLRIPEAEEALA